MPTAADERIGRELEQYDSDLTWVLENHTSLIPKYGNEFVAVLNREVLAHSPSIKDLKAHLDRQFSAEAHRAVIEFIYTEHPNLVLFSCR